MLIGTAFGNIPADVFDRKRGTGLVKMKDIFCSGTEDVFVFFVCIG
jgi:hypothetical protein